jgi:hypothetical protein
LALEELSSPSSGRRVGVPITVEAEQVEMVLVERVVREVLGEEDGEDISMYTMRDIRRIMAESRILRTYLEA